MRSKILTDPGEIRSIIRKCLWCHLGMSDLQGNPYVLPMNFGFLDDTIFLHGAQQGKKITILKQNPVVCIHFSTDHLLRYQNEEVACSWSMKYRSVLCYGTAEFIVDPEEKKAALDVIMAQYTGLRFSYNPPSIREVNCWKVKISRFEGRTYGY